MKINIYNKGKILEKLYIGKDHDTVFHLLPRLSLHIYKFAWWTPYNRIGLQFVFLKWEFDIVLKFWSDKFKDKKKVD